MDLSVAERLRRTTWDVAWVPPFAEVVARAEIVYTRSARDVAALNSVFRLDAAGERLEALVEEVSAAHERVGSRWALAGAWPAALPGLLERAGYGGPDLGAGYVLPVDRHAPRPRPAGDLRVVRVDSLERLEAALEVAYAGFGLAWRMDPDHLAHLLGLALGEASLWPHFLVLDADDRPVSSASLRIQPHLGLGYLMGGATLPEARGRGAYSALLDARLDWARRAGLPYVGLYASPHSEPIVVRRGFRAVGESMAFWQRPRPPEV